MKIFKYEVKALVEMPEDATILDIQVQEDKVVLWALVEPTNNVELRQFKVVCTGEYIEFGYTKLEYIATVQRYNGSYTEHIFEIIK